MSGLAPLPLPAVAATAHARQGIVAAMAHGFNRWAWSQATFSIDEEPWTADLDALAVRRAGRELDLSRPQLRQIPANRLQPDRGELQLGVWHRGPR